VTVRNLLASFRETSQPTAGPQCEALELRQLLAADLIGVSVDAEPPSAQPGEEVDVTLQYRNGGDESTSLFRVDVILSKDATIGNSDDVRIGRFRRFRDIDPAQVVNSTRTFDLPEDMDPGAYFVGFRLDAGQDVDEGDETNNTVISAEQLITVGGDEEADYEVLGRDDEPIADGDATPSIFDGTGFGRVLVNNGTRTREFTIVNDDDTALDIQDIVITGPNASDFQLVDLPTDPILPGDSATFSIESILPGSAGARPPSPSRPAPRATTATTSPSAAAAGAAAAARPTSPSRASPRSPTGIGLRD
jgi:hypothetical protein